MYRVSAIRRTSVLGFCLGAVAGCAATPLEHCESLVPDNYERVEIPSDLRGSLLEDLANTTGGFPVERTRRRDEAWFEWDESLIVCTFDPGPETCGNDAAAATFTQGADGWVIPELIQISTCASP